MLILRVGALGSQRERERHHRGANARSAPDQTGVNNPSVYKTPPGQAEPYAGVKVQHLKQHFGGGPLEEVVTAARTFPLASRVDVQLAIDNFFSGREKPALLGIHSALGHETPTLAHLFTRGPFPVEIGPLQHDDVDVGDPTPVRCLKNGLWLLKDRDLPFTLLLSPAMQYGRVGGFSA